MAQEATITEDTVFHPVDDDEMEELRDDAIELYEKSFEKEAEMREEEDRKIAEQVSLSHRADFHAMNKTIMYIAGSSSSAGVQEEEVKQSVVQSVMDKVKPAGKKLLKEAVKAVATSQGGVVGGLIADRLLDTSGEMGNEKTSLAKSLGSTVAKNVAEALLPDVEHKPKPKAKGTKRYPLKPQRPNPTGLTAKLTPRPKRKITSKSPPEEEEVEHMDTSAEASRGSRDPRAGSQKREETDPSSKNTKKHRKNPTPKRMEILNVEGEQPPRTRPKAKAKASASASSLSAPAPEQPPQEEGQTETKGVTKTIYKAVAPTSGDTGDEGTGDEGSV